ncbi:MAG: polysaccharide deacetylase family protein [Carboxylicivirga sp.]|jgi:peptidoglycan/xylan/chitin deacetylase (PgdA/CDA1 family)|nr:polysaccharide deacetylase family protein [Carboxylicivirga sp.]
MKRYQEKIAAQLLRFKRSGFTYFGHGIAESIKDPYIEQLHLLKDDFIEIIHFWKRMKVDFISINELLELSKKGFKRDKPWVHFTFDDGYRNNLKVLLPIMEQYQIPFTVFISSGLIEERLRMPSFIIRTALIHSKGNQLINGVQLADYDSRSVRIKLADDLIKRYKYLPYQESNILLEQIRNLLPANEWRELQDKYINDQLLCLDELAVLSKNKLVTIGAHGSKHIILHKDQKDAIIRKELEASLKYVNKDCITHAYPNGTMRDYSEGTIQIARELGVNLSFTTNEKIIGNGENSLFLPRYFLSGTGSGILKDWLFKVF